MKIEHWNGYSIRFVEIDGEWWAILKDICDALKLRTAAVKDRLPAFSVRRVCIDTSNVISNDPRPGDNNTRWMLVVNELGIYEALFASRRPEARKFRMWAGTILQKLRNRVGLEGYEVMKMTEPEIQDDIDNILDTLFWDEEKKCVMQSVTVQGGDVEQIPFE